MIVVAGKLQVIEKGEAAQHPAAIQRTMHAH
jgi:hypothetical protein